MTKNAKFLLTNAPEQKTAMVIENITIKGEQNSFHLEDGDHLIEMSLEDFQALDIRVGDTINTEGESVLDVDLSERPKTSKAFKIPKKKK